ncbi:hypothetical protein P3T76_015808 [Phytophthora citrophthora]|uniref:Uncharacterized protein n=1 Tax=Phytophthora citrophthora TaxID=4793 RepID=A0AAD9FZ26_9STRA|nr:hypothetical protein P3T76_015808 [Phytophthora citrophthora]
MTTTIRSEIEESIREEQRAQAEHEAAIQAEIELRAQIRDEIQDEVKDTILSVERVWLGRNPQRTIASVKAFHSGDGKVGTVLMDVICPSAAGLRRGAPHRGSLVDS